MRLRTYFGVSVADDCIGSHSYPLSMVRSKCLFAVEVS